MHPSLENRQRIALLIFFIGDHLLWYYGGHFQQVSLFYVVVSEIVRVGALAAAILSIWNVNFMKQALMTIMVYCFVMFPLNFNGSFNYSPMKQETSYNLLWFKRDSTVVIDYGHIAMILYLWCLFGLYIFVFKHMDRYLLDKRKLQQ